MRKGKFSSVNNRGTLKIYRLLKLSLLNIQKDHGMPGLSLKYPKLPSPADWGWILVNESRRHMWTALSEDAKSCHALVQWGCRENCKGLFRCFKANLTCDSKRRYVLKINISLSIQLVLNNTRTRAKTIHQTI